MWRNCRRKPLSPGVVSEFEQRCMSRPSSRLQDRRRHPCRCAPCPRKRGHAGVVVCACGVPSVDAPRAYNQHEAVRVREDWRGGNVASSGIAPLDVAVTHGGTVDDLDSPAIIEVEDGVRDCGRSAIQPETVDVVVSNRAVHDGRSPGCLVNASSSGVSGGRRIVSNNTVLKQHSTASPDGDGTTITAGRGETTRTGGLAGVIAKDRVSHTATPRPEDATPVSRSIAETA